MIQGRIFTSSPAPVRSGSRGSLLVLPLVAAVFALLLWPLFVLVLLSLRSTGGTLDPSAADSFTFGNYAALVGEKAYVRAALNSVGLSLAVAVGSVALCLGPAWLFVRRPFRGKRILRAVYTLPMSFSGIIVGFLMIIMLGRIGFIPQLAEVATGTAWLSGAAYQFAGLVIAYIYFEIPRATLTLEAALRKFDFQLEAAAQSLGAGRWERLLLVVLPNLRPALLSTLAVTFSVSLGSFGVALILSRRFSILPVEIFQQLTGFRNSGLAAAMSLALAALAFALGYGVRVLEDRR